MPTLAASRPVIEVYGRGGSAASHLGDPPQPNGEEPDVYDLMLSLPGGERLPVPLNGRHVALLKKLHASFEADEKAGLPPAVAGWRTIRNLANALNWERDTIKKYKVQINSRIQAAAARHQVSAPVLWERRGKALRLSGQLRYVHVP
jgi:hypothetical protein